MTQVNIHGEIDEAYSKLLNPEVEYSILDSIFGDLFGGNKTGISWFGWESMVKEEDFDIPPVDLDKLREAEIERDRLRKIHDTEGRELEKKVKERYDKEVRDGLRKRFYGREYFSEIAKLEPFVTYFKAQKKCDEIQYGQFKQFNWAKNKTKLLNKVFNTVIYDLKATLIISTESEVIINICKKGIKDIILHLNRVLAKEIDIKEKMEKPINPIEIPAKGHYNHLFSKIKTYQKLIYNTMNQYHPKFLNKLPMTVQIYIDKVMRHMIITLEKELETIKES